MHNTWADRAAGGRWGVLVGDVRLSTIVFLLLQASRNLVKRGAELQNDTHSTSAPPELTVFGLSRVM